MIFEYTKWLDPDPEVYAYAGIRDSVSSTIDAMNSYQKAADALKDAVKSALDDNVDANLQSEIWRHYQGMENIAKLEGVGRYNPDFQNISINSSNSYSDFVLAGEPVKLWISVLHQMLSRSPSLRQ